MGEVEQTIRRWEETRCKRVEVGGLLARSNIAHKWKATFRCLQLRETSFWRISTLMRESHALYLQGMILGARILLRSGLETTAILAYLNGQMRGVVDGAIDFHSFSSTTSRLLLGSKDATTGHDAINVLTTLKSLERAYPGLEQAFASLSESAHPNWEGMGFGFCRIDHEEAAADYSNYIGDMFERSHLPGMSLCMTVFEREYNDVWPPLFERLENFLVENDERLEATKPEGV